jgi:NTP pyrophosphatase (non-canonical NTP hydrolase)
MKLNDAKIRVYNQIMSYGGYWRPLSMMLRLIEETGELARAVNIKYGDKKSKNVNDGKDIALELADVFYTTLALANRYELNFNDTDINDLQLSLKFSEDNIDYLSLLAKLVQKIGTLYNLIIGEESNDEIKQSIYDIINEIIEVATLFKINLSSEFINKVGEDEIDEEKTNIYCNK